MSEKDLLKSTYQDNAMNVNVSKNKMFPMHSKTPDTMTLLYRRRTDN